MITDDIQNNELSLSAALAAACLCFLFGANAIAIKITFQGIGVFSSAAIRFTLAAAAILLWAFLTRRPLLISRDQLRHYVILTVIFSAQFLVYYFGINKSNASRSMLIANLQPFLVLFLCHFFVAGDMITKRKFFGIILGFIGVAFVFMDASTITSEFRIGDLGVLGSTTIWACNVVYIKRIIHRFEPFRLVVYPMLFSLPVLWLAALTMDSRIVFNPSVPVIGGLLYQSFVTASFCLVMWNLMMKKYGAVALNSFVFILPLVGVGLGGLILHEPISSKIIVALVLIVMGTLVVNWQGLRQSVIDVKR